jgi:hypothetical protein
MDDCPLLQGIHDLTLYSRFLDNPPPRGLTTLSSFRAITIEKNHLYTFLLLTDN